MKLGIANLIASGDVIIPVAHTEPVTVDLDILQDYAAMELANAQFDDLVKFLSTVERIHTYVVEKGCTPELVALVGEDLNTYGLSLFAGKDAEAIASLEGFIDDVKKGDIKAALLRILETIVRLLQKFNDANKLETNKLDALLLGPLVGMDKYDPVKFQGTINSFYELDDFKKIVDYFSKIEYRAGINAKGIDDKLPDLLSHHKNILKMVGYDIADDDIVHDPNYTIPRKLMSEFNIKLEDVKTIVSKTKIMLEWLRRQSGRSSSKLRAEISAVRDNETEVAKLRLEMRAMTKLIVVIERVSLVMTSHVLRLVHSLKLKK